MNNTKCTEPLIVIFGCSVHDGLARLILRRRWDWFRARNANEAIERLIATETQALVVVQSDSAPREALVLLQFLKLPWRKARAIVLDVSCGATAEGLIRSSGAMVYLPGTISEDGLEAVIDECLPVCRDEFARRLQGLHKVTSVPGQVGTSDHSSDRKAI